MLSRHGRRGFEEWVMRILLFLPAASLLVVAGSVPEAG